MLVMVRTSACDRVEPWILFSCIGAIKSADFNTAGRRIPSESIDLTDFHSNFISSPLLANSGVRMNGVSKVVEKMGS